MALPLKGLRVIDLTKDFAGPFCTMILADLGAEVVKIEKPGLGDETRAWGPPFVDGTSYYFLSLNRGKKSVALDLKQREAREVVRRLVVDSDILVESNRPGTMAKLGLDYPKLRRINHALVYCSISGFGQSGPYHDRPGYDIVAFAMSGIMATTGEPGRPPVRVSVPIADISAGHYASTAIIAALSKRLITGQGDYIDISLFDSMVSWSTYLSSYYFATGKQPSKMGSAHPSIVPYQAFHCKDKDLIIAVGNDIQWKALCSALGLSRLGTDVRFATNSSRVRNRDTLIKILSKTLRRRTASYWSDIFIQNGIPSTQVYSFLDLSRDRQVRYRKMLIRSRGRRIPQLGSPMRFFSSSNPGFREVPRLGQHTKEILDKLGLSIIGQSKIGSLKS
jgi:crotonobetainyl-CoA:carnitine CoA-transferase CaiB-like acyl-CoA transferase